MPEVVYAEYALKATGENRLELSDAEHVYLRDCLDNQLISLGISGITQELVHALYRQTVRYNKREDDLCGTRLADLISTKSSAYYCNCQIRELVEQSIVISRDGYYGRILSLNFNFAQWGKLPEENGVLLSEPEKLCAERDVASETTLDTADSEAAIVATSERTEEKALNGVEALQIQSLQASIQALRDELAGLKDFVQDLLPSLAGAAESAAENQAHKPVKPISASLVKPEDTLVSKNEKESKSKEEKAQSCAEKRTDEAVSAPQGLLERCGLHAHEERENEKETPVPQPEHTCREAPASHDTEAPSLSAVEAGKTGNKAPASRNTDTETLAFPEELKPHEKTAIAKALAAEKIEDKSICQLLLDDLSSRFKISDWQPIRSPIAYFKSLIRSYRQGNFDDTYVEDFRAKRQDAKAQAEQQQSRAERRAYLDKYNKAKNNYEQLKFSAASLGVSLRERAKSLGWTEIIEDMGFDLDAPVC